MKKSIATACLSAAVCVAQPAGAEVLSAPFTPKPVQIDGSPSEAAWQNAQWHKLDKHILGDMPAPGDFSGRYKLLWDEKQIYLLAEIIDDVLIDTHPNPRKRYWDDDTLEVFIDADASGGTHTYSHNAFAYHIALDGNVADIGNAEDDNKRVILLNEHIDSAWSRADTSPYATTWEVAMRVYPDTFSTASPSDPLVLKPGMTLGFMLAYCDNDGSEEREHFIGSHDIEPVNGDKNLGYIDASVFGELVLKKGE
ncbi:CBM9 family sugar-binding protein [Alteromonas halophila]|uniref:Carbohydrate-binding domain-containing protein n=1 Tax=Alteromonas halophila TaxID=516698 RepID=A0A918JFU6_9ALTE|nr:CBM9 family sugar-binding protein [Alteromonas halophila]GGW78313.1 hypothetical protein GCM10007391_08610 [Alteromonas halophila]